MAPLVKKCDPNVRCCVPELSSGPFVTPAHQSPFIQNPLDTYSLDTPTIFDPDFKWSDQPKRLGDLSTAELQQMAWEHHLRKANQDPVILKQRELTRQYYVFTDTTEPGELYPLNLYGNDLPPFIADNMPTNIVANPENAAYTMTWDGDNAIVHFLEIPDDGSKIRVVRNPNDGNVYIVQEQSNVDGALACWNTEAPVIATSSDNDSSSSWPFDLSTEDALLGGSIFMLGSMTQGNVAARETPTSGGSFNARMQSAAISTGIFLGLAYAAHELGVPQHIAPYVEVGTGLGLFYGADKLFAYAKMPLNMPWNAMWRAAPYMYVGSLGASYAWQAAGLKPGSLGHTSATITTTMVGYHAIKYGISRLPANSVLARAISAAAGRASVSVATMGLRTRLLVGALRATRAVGTVGLILWAIDGASTLGMYAYDRLTGADKDPTHKLDDALVEEQMDRVCNPGECNRLGKVGNWALPKIGMFSRGLRKLAHRGFNKIGLTTSFEDRVEKRKIEMSSYANDWAQAIDNELISITLGLMLAANVDPKRVARKHKGKGALESLDMNAVEIALKELFSNAKVKKYTDTARDVISTLKETKRRDWLSPSALALYDALSSNGRIDDTKVLRKHMMKLLSTTALRQRAFISQKPQKGLFTKRVEQELARMRLAYFKARKKLGLADGTVPNKLTKAQEDFLFGGREMTLTIEKQQITVSKLMSPEIYFRKRIDALEHILSVLNQSARQKDSYPDFAWHFQKAQ